MSLIARRSQWVRCSNRHCRATVAVMVRMAKVGLAVGVLLLLVLWALRVNPAPEGAEPGIGNPSEATTPALARRHSLGMSPIRATATRPGGIPDSHPAAPASSPLGWPTARAALRRSCFRHDNTGRFPPMAPSGLGLDGLRSLHTNHDTIPKHCHADHGAPRHWVDGS
jgi:hypothetical protein